MELSRSEPPNAAGYPYSENDVREQARALTGWTSDYRRRRRPDQLPLRPRAPRRGHKTIFGQTGAFAWQDTCRLCVEPPRAPDLLRQQVVELLHPHAPSNQTARRSSALYLKRNYAIARRRGDPHSPVVLPRPGDGEARRWSTSPACFARAGARSRAMVGSTETRGTAPVPPAERRRLGRGPLARHVDVPRPLDRRQRGRGSDSESR